MRSLHQNNGSDSEGESKTASRLDYEFDPSGLNEDFMNNDNRKPPPQPATAAVNNSIHWDVEEGMMLRRRDLRPSLCV